MQILKLTYNYFSQTVELIRKTDTNINWSDKQIFESFSDDHLVFGFVKNNDLIAIAILSYILDISELLYICTDKSNQSKGIANNLLNQSISELKKLNIDELFLEVHIKNYNAISLYERLGFNQISMRKNYYRHKDGSISDALIYKLDI
jgi:ribosomal-protein-alanine N-acetyltransferase